jgi:anti-sigma-K factor RskA
MKLSHERFSDLLDAYGADLARWPATEAEAARQLLAESTFARQALESIRAFDLALNWPLPAPASSAVLRQRILDRLPSAGNPSWRERLQGLWCELGGWRLTAPAMAMALLVGVSLGVALDEVPESDELLSLAQLDLSDLETLP